VQSGSNVIINGTGTVDFGTETTPAVYGLFNFTSDNCALTVESGVTLNSKSNGTFGPENGVVNIGKFSNIKFTNKGVISIQTNGANGIFCSSTANMPNVLLNEGTLTVDGGSAIVFGGSGSASITNTGTFSATNVPSNAYSASVYAGSAGPYIIKNTASGILNLASGLGISPEIKDDFPSVNVNLIDPQTPVGAKPFLVDNLLPVNSQSHNWDVVFSDEFNDTKIDVTKWSVESKVYNRNIIKVTADENQVEVKDGNLNICYRKSPTDPLMYYAGRVNTQNKYATTYGYFECRMKIVKPEGYQIAFWMMPAGDGMKSTTPADGTAHDGAEIDIIEANKLTDTYSSGMHYDGYGDDHKGAGRSITAPGLHNNEYHYFGLEWAPTFIKFYYDGKVGNTLTDPKVMVKVDEYILLTGMHWAETGWVQVDVRNNTLLNNGGTARAYIDHVRVFKNRTVSTAVADLKQHKVIADVFTDNQEIIVRFNEQSSDFASIDVYSANGMLIKKYTNIDLSSAHQTVRIKPTAHKTSALYLVKATVDGETVCHKVIF
jgi:beta-glucanase (GH16 family)